MILLSSGSRIFNFLGGKIVIELFMSVKKPRAILLWKRLKGPKFWNFAYFEGTCICNLFFNLLFCSFFFQLIVTRASLDLSKTEVGVIKPLSTYFSDIMLLLVYPFICLIFLVYRICFTQEKIMKLLANQTQSTSLYTSR